MRNEGSPSRAAELTRLSFSLSRAQFVSTVPTFGGLRFQDVAKEGVTFGDEDETEKDEAEELKTTFAPLAAYLKKELAQYVDKGASPSLTSSSCTSRACR